MTQIEDFNSAVRSYNKAADELKFLSRTIERGNGRIDKDTMINSLLQVACDTVRTAGHLIDAVKPLLPGVKVDVDDTEQEGGGQ